MGGGGAAVVTFLCINIMEKFDSFFRKPISESCLQNVKKETTSYKDIHIITGLRRIRIIPSLVEGLSCI